MTRFVAEDGCPAWFAEVELDQSTLNQNLHWQVIGDGPGGPDVGLIPTEVADSSSAEQYLVLIPRGDRQTERYHFNISRQFGANKIHRADGSPPAIRFAIAAPRAKAVELVLGDAATGYIWSDGRGAGESFAMWPAGGDIWHTDDTAPAFASFAGFDHKPYMFRVERDDGSTCYRTDIFSRCQIGAGRKDPERPDPALGEWNGTRQDVLGTRSCSVVIDPERVTRLPYEGVFPETGWQSDQEFWADEYDPNRPLPSRISDLVIYEMHVEGLGAGRPTPGTLTDAIAELARLAQLGINAIELLPTAEAEGWSWGYGSSHHFATEYAGGGRDELKHFVRACHRLGIAVLMDVVYNHWVAEGERCEWQYDSTAPESNRYYWYEGPSSRWSKPEFGYLDNGSTGYTPNFRDEFVRRIFLSSALVYLTEFHVDGFRVDLTQAIHRDNVVIGSKAPCPEANRYGIKMLREWVRALRLVKPSVLLFAEDYTGWAAITAEQDSGGIGFDAIWWSEWYHNLIGDSQNSTDNARLLHVAGFGDNRPLAMSKLAGKLLETSGRVVYNESHDQAGNATYQVDGAEVASARTIEVAVHGQLAGNRWWAEARCRVAFGLTIFSAGVPMFFMGEEVGARLPYRYNDWLLFREDFAALGRDSGAGLERFYRDAIWLRRNHAALRTGATAIVHVHDANRVLAFRRWSASGDLLIVASLANAPFDHGYRLADPALTGGEWREILNSDAVGYGGHGLSNPHAVAAANGILEVRIPICGLLVLERRMAGP